MLTARNVIGAVIAVAVISLVSACISLLTPREGSELAGDSYGTHAHGQRALYEVLTELGIAVERMIVPPTAVIGRQATLVFWKPNHGLVELEPVYLERIAEWIHSGGRVVVAPDRPSNANVLSPAAMHPTKTRRKTILEQFGLPEVKLRSIDLATGEATEDPPADEEQKKRGALSRRGYDPDRPVAEDLDELRDVLTGANRRIATRSVRVKMAGDFAGWQTSVRTLELPEKGVQVIADAGPNALGTITFDDDGVERILAALYRAGEGTVIVVGPSAVADNRSLAQGDNSVLSILLLAEPGLPIVFDEFYHGLTIRGNPLWLFTRPGYSAATLGLLALAGLVIWRKAMFLGPPLEAAWKSRRDIGDYVEAMARFLNRGASSRHFLLTEVRDGALHTIRKELHLPPGREEPDDLAAVIARHDPGRAGRLVQSVTALNRTLSGKPCREQDAVRLMQGISHCL